MVGLCEELLTKAATLRTEGENRVAGNGAEAKRITVGLEGDERTLVVAEGDRMGDGQGVVQAGGASERLLSLLSAAPCHSERSEESLPP